MVDFKAARFCLALLDCSVAVHQHGHYKIQYKRNYESCCHLKRDRVLTEISCCKKK
jgi:hypothetical protein